MSIGEKTIFTPREVIQIVTILMAMVCQYFAQTYNTNVRFNELVASIDKVYIYIDEIKKDDEITDMRLQSVELGVRKNELDIAIIKGK